MSSSKRQGQELTSTPKRGRPSQSSQFTRPLRPLLPRPSRSSKFVFVIGKKF